MKFDSFDGSDRRFRQAIVKGNKMKWETNCQTKSSAPRMRRHRAGLSILEFIACAVAVLGGAWLGALYLGVDVKHLTYTALSDAHLLDKLPSGWQPADPNANAATHEQLVTELHQELGSLRKQVAELHDGGGAATTPASAAPAKTEASSETQTTKEKTLAYWSHLRAIVVANAKLQHDADSAFNATNASKVFAVKGHVSRFSAKALQAVPTQDVDDAALCFGHQLQLWYERGGDLYDRAVKVLETPVGQQARVELNEEWKKASEQHQNEERLLNEKASALRSSLNRIYGVEFPEFGEPAKPAAGKEPTAKAT